MTEQERTAHALKNNVYAIDFCNAYFRACQVWDDLIDRDKDISDKDINNAFISMLVEMPNNPFFQANRTYLAPIMMNGIIDWMDANDMEDSGDKHQQMVAYTLRDSFNNLLLHCAYLIGGKDWLDEIRYQFRLAIYDEPLEDYLESLQ